jgi:hypothetical protein
VSGAQRPVGRRRVAGGAARRALAAGALAAGALAALPGRAAGQPAATTPAAAGAVAAAAAEAAAMRAVTDRRLVDGLDAATFATVRTVVVDAARQGLPVEPLVARALAGVELGAPPARVAGAVRALAGRLVAARDALAPSAGAAEVTAGADALAVGVPAAVLRDVRRLAAGRSAAVALGVLAQLVSRGVPPARAAEAVTALVRRGARPGQLAALDAAVQADVAAGVPAGRALDARARELAGGGRLTAGPLVPPLSPDPRLGVTTTDALAGERPGGIPKPAGASGGETPPPPRQPPRRP